MPILVLLTFLIPLAYSPFFLPFGFMDAFEIKRTILELGTLGFLGMWAFQMKGMPRSLQISAPAVAAILYVAYCAFHVLFVWPGHIPSCKLYEMFCLLVVFLAAGTVAKKQENVLKLFRVLTLAAFLACAWGLLQAGEGREPFATLGNRNFFATFALSVIPVAILLCANAWKEKRRAHAIFYTLAFVLCISALILCKSKAAWLALASAGLLFLIIRKQWKAIGLLLLTAILFFRFSSMEHLLRELSQDVRPYLWEGAWKMGWSHFSRGVGLGRFFIEIPKYRASEYFLMAKSADTTLHAHNGYLEIFTETGWIGLLLFLFLIVLIFCNLQKGVPHALVVCIVLFALLVKSFFDMDMQVISSAYLFWFFAGLASANEYPAVPAEFPGLTGMIRLALLALITFLFVEYTLPFLHAQWAGKTAAEAAERGDWFLAQRCYQEAMNAEPGLADMPFRLGYAYARTGNWEEALDAYRVVRRIAPAYSNVLFNMAAVCRHKGDYGEAMRWLNAGFAVNPYSIPGHSIAQEIFLLTGQPEKARREEVIIESVHMAKRN